MKLKVSALFVEKGGCYYELSNIDPWDIERNAKKYQGDNPVIAHPPCKRWCKMSKAIESLHPNKKEYKTGNDNGCFASAFNSVNRFGGVLEHPAQTIAWRWFGIDKPTFGCWTKSGIGWVTEVWQSAYGHRCNKATWLYYVGHLPPLPLKWKKIKGTHQVGGACKNRRTVKPEIPKKEREATPVAFRDELIKLVQYGRQKDLELLNIKK